MITALISALHGMALPGLALPGLAPSGLAPSGLAMLAAITLTAMLVALLAHSARIAAAVTAIPLGCRAAALREKSWRAAFLPQRDPGRGRAGPGPEHPRRPRRPPDPCLT